MEEGNMLTKMEVIKDNSNTVRNMEMENIHIMMEQVIKEIGNRTKEMDLGSILGMMEEGIQACGRKE